MIADRRVLDRARTDLWAAHGHHQIYLTTLFTKSVRSGPAIVFAAQVPDNDHYMGSHGGKALPAYRDGRGERPNLAPGLLEELSQRIGATARPEDLLAYIAAIAAHPGYPLRFRSDLRTPGARIPLTTDVNLWRRAVGLGERVIWLHTYGERYVNAAAGRPAGPPLDLRPSVLVPIPGSVEGMPQRIAHDGTTSTLYVGDGALGPVPSAVWNYNVSGTPVVKKWFGYRAKKPLLRWCSPLNDIVADTWDFTDELRNLLAVLQGCVLLEPQQAATLEAVLDGPLLTAFELEDARVLPPPADAEHPFIETLPRLF